MRFSGLEKLFDHVIHKSHSPGSLTALADKPHAKEGEDAKHK